jgi:anthranilate phosphoribosyltransferase
LPPFTVSRVENTHLCAALACDRVDPNSETFFSMIAALTAGLAQGVDLSAEQVNSAVEALVSPEVDDQSKAQFLKALRAKGESAEEIAGFAKALLARAIDPGIDAAQLPGPMLDVCGTGGDRMEMFNVSTITLFVLAAAGAVVVKHGNRAITSRCGGADVLEELGVRIDLPPAALRACLAETGAGFIFAPNYHPAFKAIVAVRKQLAAQGIPTIFNMLGPLLNPAKPAHQLIGIFSNALLDRYAVALAALGRGRGWVVHGDGMDELSTTGISDGREVESGAVHAFRLDPAELGLGQGTLADLRGGDREANAKIVINILGGHERGPKRDMVLLNAAAGLVITGLVKDMPEGIEAARAAIESGAALAKLRALQAFQPT